MLWIRHILSFSIAETMRTQSLYSYIPPVNHKPTALTTADLNISIVCNMNNHTQLLSPIAPETFGATKQLKGIDASFSISPSLCLRSWMPESTRAYRLSRTRRWTQRVNIHWVFLSLSFCKANKKAAICSLCLSWGISRSQSSPLRIDLRLGCIILLGVGDFFRSNQEYRRQINWSF